MKGPLKHGRKVRFKKWGQTDQILLCDNLPSERGASEHGITTYPE